MTISSFFKRNWIHFAAIGICLIIALVYFSPQLQGNGLKQHDIQEYIGSSHEIQDFREHNAGKEPLWTNSMFGGMPTTQISQIYSGNLFAALISGFLTTFPAPLGIMLLYMICAYIGFLFMRVNPWIALIGALAFSFLSYDVIILQAGHNTKGIAIAFMLPIIGSFFMTFRHKWLLGAALSGVFMAFEMAANHLQITYYLGFLILALGLVEFFRAFKTKQFGLFFKSTVAIGSAYLLAIAVNYGNIAMTSDYAKFSIRGGNDITITPDGNSNEANSTAGLDRDYVTQYSYGIGESFTLLSPYIKGGGSMAFQSSPFVDQIENSDLTQDEKQAVLQSNAYWGNQPIVSGPVYLGVILVFLALLGMIYIKDPSKYALLAIAILTLMLSWGKNYMGLTDFFLDHVPGYNKFRAVTIILVIVELCIPVLAVLFLNKLIQEKEAVIANIKPFYYASAAFVLFLFIVKTSGIDTNYLSAQETDPENRARQEQGIIEQIMGTDEATLAQNGIDKNNPQQVQQIVTGEMERYDNRNVTLSKFRAEIFDSSMNRSLLFVILAIGCLFLFFRTALSSAISLGLLGVIILIDILSVTRNYLNNEEEGSGYKYWAPVLEARYPVSPEIGDLEILEQEAAANPSVRKAIELGQKEGNAKAIELEATGNESRRIENAYAFAALNRSTNFRVFDASGGFNSARASYFHKSIGGYHGAKLRSIQNLADFHINRSNNKVLDMLNVKYILQPSETGLTSKVNPTALGNGWFVKRVQTVQNSNEEIVALGSEFSLKNCGTGKFIVNGKVVANAKAFGNEKLQYLLPGVADTLSVPLSNGIPQGVEVVFVRDVNGKTDLIMKQGLDSDTTKSFTSMVQISVVDEFNPQQEVILNKTEAAKLSKRTFSGEGKIKLTKYAPNQLNYSVEANDKALAIFSEIYYSDGWSATIDGKEAPIIRANYLLRGLEIPKGKHQVVFKFEQAKFGKLNTLGLISSVLLMFLLIFSIVRTQKNEKEKLIDA